MTWKTGGKNSHKMVCRPPLAATPAAAMSATILAVVLAAAPVEAKYCYSSDVLPQGQFKETVSVKV